MMSKPVSHRCVLNTMSRTVASTLDPYAAMRPPLRSIARLTNCDVLGAYALEENGEWLAPVQGYHLPPHRLDALREAKLSVKTNALYAKSYAAGRPIFTPNVGAERGTSEALRTMVPHRAELFVPIPADGSTIGGIVAAWTREAPAGLEPAEVEAIGSIATEARVVIQNARRLDAYVHRQCELPSLWSVTRDAQRELERTAILAALEAPIGPGLAVDTMEIYWRRPRSTDLNLLFAMTEGVLDRDVPRVVAARSAGLATIVMREGRALRTHDAPGDIYRHWLGVPVLAGDDTLGVVAVAHRHFPFTASHESRLSRAAQLLAVALYTAALGDHQLSTREAAVERGRDFSATLADILLRAQRLREDVTDTNVSAGLRAIESSVIDI